MPTNLRSRSCNSFFANQSGSAHLTWVENVLYASENVPVPQKDACVISPQGKLWMLTVFPATQHFPHVATVRCEENCVLSDSVGTGQSRSG